MDTSSLGVPFGTAGCTTNCDTLHTTVVNARTADGNQAGSVCSGILQTGVPMAALGGCGGGGVSVGPVGAGGTMAHEIAHACGAEARTVRRRAAARPNFPDLRTLRRCLNQQVQLDVNNGNIANPATARDFMWSCGPAWISPYHHRLLLDNARFESDDRLR